MFGSASPRFHPTGSPARNPKRPRSLSGLKIGARIEWKRRVVSTMDEVRDALARGAGHGLVIVADEQTAGRGRHERKWLAQPAGDLLFSLGLRPSKPTLSQLSILAGLGVAEAVAPLIPRPVTIKWPNDVRVHGRKLAGVLVETRVMGGSVEAVVGVGLNVNSDPAEWTEIANVATSLRRESGKVFDRREVLDRILDEFDHLYERLTSGESLVDPWAGRLDTLGAHVAVRRGREVVRGIAETVDETGRLGVRLHEGQIAFFDAGEVTLQSPQAQGGAVRPVKEEE